VVFRRAYFVNRAERRVEKDVRDLGASLREEGVTLTASDVAWLVSRFAVELGRTLEREEHGRTLEREGH
jgi:hypothetical protein